MKRKEPEESILQNPLPPKRYKVENSYQEALPKEDIKIIPSPQLIAENTKRMKPTVCYKLIKAFNMARASDLTLMHGKVQTPVYMPVGTKGAMKTLTTADMESMDCQIHLVNTYHLDLRPGPAKLQEYGGVHKFMGWKHNLLTDSGGFQMVSLNDLMSIKEKGVTFKSIVDENRVDGSIVELAPEDSIHVQNQIGADIMMALDDVVHVLVKGPRVEDACKRTVRWLDRCIAAHKRPEEQALFGIVQGGLDEKLRDYCLEGKYAN
jgi:queuine tRNA-ribosyltransferase